MHGQTYTGTPKKPTEWRSKIVPKKKKLMNIAQKMLKFQAETSLFLMRKTKHREGGKRKDEKKDRKKEKWRSQKVKIRMWR